VSDSVVPEVWLGSVVLEPDVGAFGSVLGGGVVAGGDGSVVAPPVVSGGCGCVVASCGSDVS